MNGVFLEDERVYNRYDKFRQKVERIRKDVVLVNMNTHVQACDFFIYS